MPCIDALAKTQDTWDAVLDADAALKLALHKLETSLETSLIACAGGWAAGVLLGLGGLVGGGVACISALLAADDAAAAFEYALTKCELANDRHHQALMAELHCFANCQ